MRRTTAMTLALAIALLMPVLAAAGDGTGTGFMYQGQLKRAGNAVSDAYSFRFTLWDAETDGNQIGGMIEKTGVPVVDGVFSVLLDFGPNAFDGDARWLEVALFVPETPSTDLRSKNTNLPGSYQTMRPRQWLTPTPYALALPGMRTQQNDVSHNVIGGSTANQVTLEIVGATISGGGAAGAANQVGADFATVGGGEGNAANGFGAVVGGGTFNLATGEGSFIGGGADNFVGPNAEYGAIGGGLANESLAPYAVVGGGYGNSVAGYGATVAGGKFCQADGLLSFSAGYRAVATHQGAMLFADTTGYDFESAANNEFAVRATGGVRFVTAVDQSTPKSFVWLEPGSGSWSALTHSSYIRNQAAVDTRQVLDAVLSLPIKKWGYKGQLTSTKHMGPTAEDFRAAFQSFGVGVNENDKHISLVDYGGVSLAAIQGLNSVVEDGFADQGGQIEALQGSVGALQTETGNLTTRVTAVEGSVQGLQATDGAQQSLIDGLVTTVGALESTVSGLQSAIGTQEANLAAAQDLIAQLQSQMGTLQGDVTAIQGSVAALQGEISALNDAVGSRDADIAALQAENLAQAEAILNLETANADQGAQIAAMQTQLADLEARVAALEGSGGDGNKFGGFTYLVPAFGLMAVAGLRRSRSRKEGAA